MSSMRVNPVTTRTPLPSGPVRNFVSNGVYEHELTKPVFNYYAFASGGSFGGAEDPRLVRVDEENDIYMTYTACDEGLRIALTSIRVKDFLQKRWRWKKPVLISPPNQLSKNWVMFPEKINGSYAFLLSVVPKIEVVYVDNLGYFDGSRFLNSSRGFGPIKNSHKNCWDKWIKGAGPIPMRTEYGWLIFYHGMDGDWSKYKVGAMLLDLNNPEKVLVRSTKPILEPEEVYENNGFKAGVVFASGAVVKSGKLLIYYGAADSYVSVAYANLDNFLEELGKGIRPKLERKILQRPKK